MKKYMPYEELKNTFREHERKNPKAKPLCGGVLISSDSFTKDYTEDERIYLFNSRNKAFMPNMGGYSIYANSKDGSDIGVRIEAYLSAERGGKDGWQIEKCWLEVCDDTV